MQEPQNYYTIKHILEVPSAPHIMSPVGNPIQEDLPCTLVIMSINNSNKMLINANVLRGALLSNPEKTKELLGIEVKDVAEYVVQEEQPKQKKSKKQKEEKKVDVKWD